MRHQVALALLLFHSAIGIRQSAFSDVPQLINYQGRLLNGTNLVNGTVGLSLRLFNGPSGGSSIYEDSNNVTVVDGLYSTFIGDHPTNGAFLSALTNPAVWVEVAVNGVALSPRERLASVGYSLATRGIAVNPGNNGFVLNPAVNALDPTTLYATLGGGLSNRIEANAAGSFLGGGSGNSIQSGSHLSFLGGGDLNSIEPSAYYAFLGGGQGNRIRLSAAISFLGGGFANTVEANSSYSVLGGGELNRLGPDSHHSVLGGGLYNSVQTNVHYSVLAGGVSNRIETDVEGSFLGAGQGNSLGEVCYYSFLGGGYGNRMIDTAWYAVLAGGASNSIINAYYSVLGGGRGNYVFQGEYGVLAGGDGNRLNYGYANAISGGAGNSIGDNTACSVIAGGQSNAVGNFATHALAAGYRAKVNHEGSFVWADRKQADFASTASNQFLIRAGGGVGINTNNPVQALHVNGDVQVGRPVVWAGSEDNRIINFGDANFVYIGEVGADDRMALRAGGFQFINGNIGVGVEPTTNRIEVAGGAVCTGPAWVNASDRNLKDGFQAVDVASVLARVAALPIATWHYTSEGADLRHIGPTAQDFHAAFGVGYNDTSIATVDADGVALAAIQALAKENAEFRVTNAELTERLEKLERELQAIRQEHSR